ncbi:MAG: glycosyltransferase family 39 protein [Deltaproteobacteria bacterium]|nr:glycosyltransferase family 39 protein [Deltaproteobacteria bacterium]MBI2530831.1 glycosyltransferase family 39 protein [Deltaproteobacteria bacterium]
MRRGDETEERFSNLLFRTSLAGCALGIVATVYFLAGLAGLVGNLWLNALVVAALAVGTFFFFHAFFANLRETNWLGRALAVAIIGIIGIEIILSLVPPTARDELTHHLAIPKLYARAGRIVEVPIAPYAYFPMLLDMLYTPWLLWGADSVPKLVHALFGYFTGLSLFAYLSRRMNAVYGLLGFLFFISIPTVLRLSHWAYVDLGVAFYSTASLLCLLRWREEKDSRTWLLLAAVSAGFAAATKPNGFVAASMLSFLFLFISVQERQRGLAKIAAEWGLFVAVGALPCLPWLAKNWLQTGNPFFPLMAGFFPGSGVAEGDGSVGFAGLDIFAKRALLYGENWWQIAALPLRLFFAGRDDDPQHFDGVLSPLLILLLPWVFKGKWLSEKRLLLGFALLYLANALFLVDMRVRYVLAIAPPLAALAVYGVFNVYLSIKRPVYLLVGLLLFAGVHGYYLWGYFAGIAPLAYLTGVESRESYLARVLADYPAFQYVNRNLPPTANIYLLFMGRRAYYCERDYFHDGGELPGFLLGAVRAAKNPADIHRQLTKKRLTHLLVREELLVRFLRDNLSPAELSIWDGFASGHLQGLFHSNGYSVVQIHG